MNSTHIITEGFYVKAAIIHQLKCMCVPDCAYMKTMFINFIYISLYDITLMQNILYQSKREVAVWKRLRCPQRTWWQIVATPYTGFSIFEGAPGCLGFFMIKLSHSPLKVYFQITWHQCVWLVTTVCLTLPHRFPPNEQMTSLNVSLWWRHNVYLWYHNNGGLHPRPHLNVAGLVVNNGISNTIVLEIP